jgi:hypothetical protein
MDGVADVNRGKILCNKSSDHCHSRKALFLTYDVIAEVLRGKILCTNFFDRS